MPDFVLNTYLALLRATAVRKMEYTLPDGKAVEIVTFKAPRPVAQYLFFSDHIIIEERIFSDYSKNFQDFVISHELGHKKTNQVILIPLLTVMIGFLVIGTMALVLSFMLLISMLVTQHDTWDVIIKLLSSGLPYLVLGIAISWFLEFYATFYAFGKIGFENSVATKGERKVKGLPNILQPPDNLVEFVYKFLKRTGLA